MESDDDNNAEIQVDFEARTPSGNDFHGIKRLLQQLFLKAHIDLAALTEILLMQSADVGSVIKQSELPDQEDSDDDMDDDDHVFGISSVINLTERQKESECIDQLHSFLLERGKNTANDQTLKLLRELLNADKSNISPRAHQVGLLITERFVNIPPQIAPHLYENLLKEIAAANQKGQKFHFDYYIHISKLYKAQAKKKTKSSQDSCVDSSLDTFSNSEDELLFTRESTTWFEYSVANESDTGLVGIWDAGDDVGMCPFRRVSIIPANELPLIVAEIRENFGKDIKST